MSGPERPVIVADYDPAWPERYRSLAAGIGRACGDLVPRLEHVGSTSVPGCAAKPIIDILGGVARLADAEAACSALEALGYAYITRWEGEMPYRRFYTQTDVHFHVVEVTHAFFQRHLDFRNWLRTHDADRDAYVALKRELAARHRADREGYTDGKADFIRRIEGLARA